jgi:hypothetical protein
VVNLNYPTSKKKEYELRLGANGKIPLNGGLCLDQESDINLTQSPYMVNLNCDDGGMLIKRYGQAYVYETSLGSGAINGVYSNYKDKTIIAHGTKLYTQVGSNQPVEVYSGLANSKAFFFVYNGTLYMINGTNYIKYDGTTVSTVTPYIPKVSINRKPDGSESTVNESWNMIGTGFTDQFNGDGTSTAYKLSFDSLENTTVTVNLAGLTEGSGFTVNRTTGYVNFSAAPASGLNNVQITAYKTFSGKVDSILKCKRAIEFSNRMFFTGNDDIPNFYFASGVTDSLDASYFPEKYRYGVRGADKKVTAFAVHYGKLIVFKEDLTATVEAALGLDNTASFPISYLNTEIGCDMPDTVQLVNNNVVFCNTYGGVHIILSTLIPGEKNITPVSDNINGNLQRPGLLQEDVTMLKSASSFDLGNKYYICVDDHCYIWDYKISFDVKKPKTLTWFYYDNIKANCFFSRDNELCYGHRELGHLVKFIAASNDFGQPINAIWKSKIMDFGYTDYEKTINAFWLTTRANSSSSISVNIYNDKHETESIPISSADTKSFSWGNFSWNNFSWKVLKFDPVVKEKIRNSKRVIYFQFEISNNEYNKNLSIIALVLKYTIGKQVK